MILILDNFDSFTYNLVDYFTQLQVDCKVFRNNLTIGEIFQYDYKGIVLSPGPEIPQKAGCMMEIIRLYAHKLPFLGICLGHQAIGEYFGAKLVKAKKPMHGKLSEISLRNNPIFQGLPSHLSVVRYHSLVLNNLPSCLESISETSEEEIMAVSHKYLPIWGLQFHPEAVLTEGGLKMLENWITFNKIAS